MSEQETAYDKNEYARPNQAWHCGHAAEGNPCPLGPNGKGICVASTECVPYPQGDTWKCARTRARGGPCEEGPLPDGKCCQEITPCRPVRSVLAKRRVVTLSFFVLAIGVALVFVSLPQREKLVSPGPVTRQHSSVTCSQCHVAGGGKMSDWLHASLDSKPAATQSQLCLRCHQELGDHPLNPHALSDENLTTITTRIQKEEASNSKSKSTSDHGQLACATCHGEHHGRDSSLTEMTNRQCQTCHAKPFSNFAEGHPAFSFSFDRRTRIYFDHVTHFEEHFDPKAKIACSQCHRPDPTGRHIDLRGFEESCAQCHAEHLEQGLSPDLVFAALPAMDTTALRENGIEIGHWPPPFPVHVDATGDVTKLPLLTNWLIQSHEDRDVLSQLKALDLRDLRQATPEQLAAVGKLAWALKEISSDLIQEGQPHLQQRLEQVLGPDAETTEIRELVQRMPVELTRRMHQQWLPGLNAELQARRDGEELSVVESTVNAKEVVAAERKTEKAIRSGWLLRDADLSLRYRNTGHADEFLKALLDLEASHENQDLFSAFGSGRCLKCHSVDSTDDGVRTVHWKSKRSPKEPQHEFTIFNHAPHTTGQGNKRCTSCHKFERTKAPQQQFRPEYFSADGRPCLNTSQSTGGFHALKKASCAKCHTKNAATDNCLTCHSYHVH